MLSLKMRIIQGIYKKLKLKSPPKNIRPTKDSLKETIFNILRGYIKDAVVCDLFSGSGSLGFILLIVTLKHCARI
jgi:16S rRNA (guanine966-N2)-methyltransferase